MDISDNHLQVEVVFCAAKKGKEEPEAAPEIKKPLTPAEKRTQTAAKRANAFSHENVGEITAKYSRSIEDLNARTYRWDRLLDLIIAYMDKEFPLDGSAIDNSEEESSSDDGNLMEPSSDRVMGTSTDEEHVAGSATDDDLTGGSGEEN